MKYFQCKSCGFGPVNATQAFLDLGGRCHAGHKLAEWRRPSVKRPVRAPAVCAITGVTGARYCGEPAVTVNGYCERHNYLDLGRAT